jgi:NAD+ synthase
VSDPFGGLDTFDADVEADRICEELREIVQRVLRRRGAVVGVSGGVDSGVVLALCAEALGAESVIAVLSPERESGADTLELSRTVVASVGTAAVEHDLSPVLDAFGCYRLRDEALAAVIPEYGPGWRSKIVLPSALGAERLRVFTLVAQGTGGERVERRLPADSYRSLVAAMNFKQRARKTLEYYHADRLGYAVAGTPNRLEYDQGFFVKHGDGAADVKPIAHLYKTQVYALAAVLGLPSEVRSRTPTTDTYGLEQTQEEFFFAMPLEILDVCLFARDHGIDEAAVVERTGLSAEQIQRLYSEIDAKRRAAHYLHLEPQLLSPGRA